MNMPDFFIIIENEYGMELGRSAVMHGSTDRVNALYEFLREDVHSELYGGDMIKIVDAA